MQVETFIDKFRGKIRREALIIFDDMDEGLRLLYTSEMCQMCTAHLTVRQLNRVIIEGVPPVCLKCYKEMKQEIEKCAPLFEQLSL